MKVFKDKAYFGTSNGLFVTNIASRKKQFEAIPFELINGTNGQVWNLYEFKDELLLGHHEGTFRIEDNRAINLSRLPGTWTALQPNGKPNVLIEGNYQGLNRYEFRNGHWQYTQKIDSMIEESCRIMAQDKSDNIWVAHPYRGVYKIILNKEKTKVLSTKLYNSKQGFPSDLYIYVFRIGESVVFSGETGIYQYNEDKDLFESESDTFNLPENITYNEEGIVLLYNAYEIAPYATGILEFEIPYSEIENYLAFYSAR